MANIAPTVGRSLYYYPTQEAVELDKPTVALLAGVNDDGTVNLATFDNLGQYQGGRTGVQLVQEGDEIPADPHARWMPYQVGQAKQSEATKTGQ
jgi:hypothetical protein